MDARVEGIALFSTVAVVVVTPLAPTLDELKELTPGLGLKAGVADDVTNQLGFIYGVTYPDGSERGYAWVQKELNPNANNVTVVLEGDLFFSLSRPWLGESVFVLTK